MAKKFTVEDIDKRMDDVRERVRVRRASSAVLPPVPTGGLNPLDVQNKLLAAARRRAERLSTPESLI